MIRFIPRTQVVAAWTSHRRTYAVLTLSIGAFALLTAFNLGILAALVILERAPAVVAVATAGGVRPPRREKAR